MRHCCWHTCIACVAYVGATAVAGVKNAPGISAVVGPTVVAVYPAVASSLMLQVCPQLLAFLRLLAYLQLPTSSAVVGILAVSSLHNGSGVCAVPGAPC